MSQCSLWLIWLVVSLSQWVRQNYFAKRAVWNETVLRHAMLWWDTSQHQCFTFFGTTITWTFSKFLWLFQIVIFRCSPYHLERLEDHNPVCILQSLIHWLPQLIICFYSNATRISISWSNKDIFNIFFLKSHID